MHVNHACDLCQAQDFEIVCDRDRSGQTLDTVICRKCGLVSHAHIPTDAELAAYYRDQYRLEYNREASPSKVRVVREWRRGQERFEAVRADLRPADRVLEIGSGIGCNLKQFELAGHDTVGVEPGAGFAEYSRKQLNCQVINSVFDDLSFHQEFDMVLMIHVLEHLPHPSRALSRVRGFLKEGGRLLIEVPNLGAPHAAPGRLFHSAHIYNFTVATLSSLASACGFQVLRHLTTGTDRNLGLLLRKCDQPALSLDPEAYARTMKVLRKSSWAYYARTQYLRDQCRRYTEQIVYRLRSGKEYEHVLHACGVRRAA